jgi:hypothetical protein
MEALYRSVHEAVTKSLSIAMRNGYVLPSMGGLLKGSRATDDSRLTILEMHGQAGLILGQLEKLPIGEQAVAWLVYGKEAMPNDAKVEMAAALVPDIVARLPTGVFARRTIAMLVLKSCGYRGYGVRRVALQSSQGWKDVDALYRQVDKVCESLRAMTQGEVERQFREKGWV